MTAAPENVRNVVLVGHSGVGKTSLVESLLAATGTITRPGRVADGTTVTDFDECAIRQQRSVSLALAPLEYRGVRVNLLDTPGYADFVGELRAGLRAADAALFVVSATDPLDAAVALLWQECADVGMPRAIVISRLDQPRADFAAAVAACQQAFGTGVAPVYLPLVDDATGGGDARASGLVGLLTRTVARYRGGVREEAEPTTAGPFAATIAMARASLIENIISESEDETLLERYLAGEELDTKMLIADLETAVARGSFYPVLGYSAATGFGHVELLEVLTSAFPSPTERRLPTATRPDGTPVAALNAEPEGALLAEVVKTTSDPYVGRLSLVRVFSGTLRPDQPVHVCGHHGGAGSPHRGEEPERAPASAERDRDLDERVGHLSRPLGSQQRPITECRAGDICAVAKLTRAETGDTLSGADLPLLIPPWRMPEPLLPVALVAASRADEDKLGQGLTRLVAEDPTLRLERSPDTGQLLLWCLGEAHADVALERLRLRGNVTALTEPVKVALRETFTAATTAVGRHVKQSGGHGQYAVCRIEVEPLPTGSGFEFCDRIIGGAIPGSYIPSVEKGLRAQLARGVLAGYPVVDVRVTLVDGKTHSVDSSDMAFQIAGGLALREAAAQGHTTLLEPILSVGVLVDDGDVGTIAGDLAGRRGRIVGTEPVGVGRTLVRGEVPETEMVRYAVDLRSLTHGTGSFTRAPLGYEPVPTQLAARWTASG